MYWRKLAQLLRPKARRGATAQSQRQTDRLLLLPSYPNAGFISCVCGKHNKTQADKAKGQHSSWEWMLIEAQLLLNDLCVGWAHEWRMETDVADKLLPQGGRFRGVWEWRRRKPVSCIAANVRAWQQLLHATFAAGNSEDGQERAGKIGKCSASANGNTQNELYVGVATSILWVECVSVGYVVRICLAGVYICVLSLPLKIASKMWNEIVARQEVYAATASSAAISAPAACNTHTYRYADSFLEIQSQSAARDHSDSWSGLPLALWFMRAAQIHIHIYTAGKPNPNFCLCILAFPELNLIFCLNCGRTNVEKFF